MLALDEAEAQAVAAKALQPARGAAPSQPAGFHVATPREFDEVLRNDLKWLDASAERPVSRRGSGTMRPSVVAPQRGSAVARTVFGSDVWS